MKRALILLALAALLPAGAHAGRGKKLTVPQFYERTAPALATVEYVQEYIAGGSRRQTRDFTDGFVISPDGLVLISGKVRFPSRGGGRLSGGSRPELSDFTLHFADGRKHEAEVVAFENDLNLGLLRVTDLADGEELPHLSFREGYEAQVGDGLRTMTLYSEEYGREPVFSGAGVNALLETPQEVWSLGVSGNLLGAPLCDVRGQVVGVVAQVPMSPLAGRQTQPDLTGPVGLSYDRFAQWLEQASQAAEQVAEPADDGDAAWMGVMFHPLEPELAAHLGISPGGGVVVSKVVKGSPADIAGLKPLDVLVERDGERIDVTTDADTPRFAAAIRELAAGTVVRFVRESPGGQRADVSLTLVEAPKSELFAERLTDDAFELTVREITLDTLIGQRLDPDTAGVVVDGVTRAGWAGLAGLGPGLIVQRINQHDVTDLASFEAAVAKVKAEQPDKVLFFVRLGRSTRFLVAEPDWDELGK